MTTRTPAETIVGTWTTLPTPDGPFTVITTPDDTVLASGWTAEPATLIPLIHHRLQPAELVRSTMPAIADAVIAYYDGDHDAPPAIPVTQRGGAFITQLWATVRTVPAGSTVTYGHLAELAGRAAAVRAAGTCCVRNAANLFVPVHRVIRGDGTLGGFRYGLELKQALLAREAGE
ncbi:MAG: methylated-DNA--[protein]-cysteine S-methyltransferase [Gordonia sp. (in: high G+C Gram-positive bacteria)]